MSQVRKLISYWSSPSGLMVRRELSYVNWLTRFELLVIPAETTTTYGYWLAGYSPEDAAKKCTAP